MKWIESSATYKKTHKTRKSKKLHSEEYYNNHLQDLQKNKFEVYKRSAKKRSLEFSLSFEEFMSFWQQPCFYCGEEILAIGLDRFNNKEGYEKGNVVSCCTVCNRMKLDYNISEFLEKVRRIYLHRCKNYYNSFNHNSLQK